MPENSDSENNDLPLSAEQIARVLMAANESVYIGSGAGSKYSQFPKFLSQFDKLSYNILPPNQELTGFTFMSRPCLNLSTSNIRQSRNLQFLDTFEVGSYAFAIRCWLDPYFEKSVRNNKLIFNNPNCAFLAPVTNCLQGISGWPDKRIITDTTTGGFFSEDLTYAVGSDRNSATVDLTLNFRDISGGFMFSLLLTWLNYIDEVTRGSMSAYPDHIDDNLLDYTVSIYRFTTDPSKRHVLHWAKATGCFPTAHPVGDAFNFSNDSWYVEGFKEYSIQFTVNKVDYFPDPVIPVEFNHLARRYCSTIEPERGMMVDSTIAPETNFMGLPYINLKDGKNTMMWMVDPTKDNLIDPLKEVMSEYAPLMARNSTNQNLANSSGSQNQNIVNK